MGHRPWWPGGHVQAARNDFDEYDGRAVHLQVGVVALHCRVPADLTSPCGASGLFMRFAWMVQPRNYLLLACHAANETVQVASPARPSCCSQRSQNSNSKRNFGAALCTRRRTHTWRTSFSQHSGLRNRSQPLLQQPTAPLLQQPTAPKHRNNDHNQSPRRRSAAWEAAISNVYGYLSAAALYCLGAAASAGAPAASAGSLADMAAA